MSEASKTLSQAEQEFKSFLLANGYPQTICWITPNDLIVSSPHEYWIRKRKQRAEEYVGAKFAQAVANGMGVELRAICANADQTFATVFVPTDREDAEYRLMRDGVKLSCPAERPKARVTGNALRWLLLSRRDAGRSTVLFQ